MSPKYFQAPSDKSDRLHRHGCNWSNSRVTVCFISCNIFKESHKYFLSGTENDGTPCGGAAYWLYAGGIIILVAVSKFRIKTRRSSSRHLLPVLDILAILYKEHAMADGNISLGEDCCICILWLFTGLMSLAEIGVFIWVRPKVFKNLLFSCLKLF